MPHSNLYWPAGGQKYVKSLTAAAGAFVIEHSRLLDLQLFLSEGVLEKIGLQTSESASQKAKPDPREHLSLIRELVLTRTVDNFLCFVSDMFALIYKAKPEMLRTSEQERLDFILQFSDMDQLREAIAEKRVERLSYRGLRELAEYTQSNMGFSLFTSREVCERAALLVEFRNICIHARGVIGSGSARRFPELQPQVGSRLAFTAEGVRADRQFIEDCVFDIDERATTKYGLPAQTVPLPPADL